MAEPSSPTNESIVRVPAVLDAEEDEYADSAIGDGVASSTDSFGSSIMKFREENGRTYQFVWLFSTPMLLLRAHRASMTLDFPILSRC